MKQVALITGGTRGIGLGIARELAKLGFDLAINGVREEHLVSKVIDELREGGIDVIYCKGNIALAEHRSQIIDQVMKHFGHLNYLVNNAGIAPRVRLDLLDTTEESFDQVLEVNLKAPFFLTQAVAREMINQKQKDPGMDCQIVTVTSISAAVASVNRGEYCISKSGLAMMTQLFATRLGEHDIPVYEIRPGVIETDMTSKVKDKYDSLFDQGLALQKRWGRPEDVGKAVAGIVAGNFPYSTGQVFMVDGGLTVSRL